VTREITVTVNGVRYTETVEHRLLLCDFLRETIGLTGTHIGCGVEGRCGACTVIYEGVAAKSCLMLAVQADGASLLTVEGLAQSSKLHPLQRALRDHHGLQCGFCTPGLLMSLYDFLKAPSRDPQEIRRAINGNLCRCTGYVHIVEAVVQAIDEFEQMNEEERALWFPV
jgi:carbon-monoxide dehydrogenase small subunit